MKNLFYGVLLILANDCFAQQNKTYLTYESISGNYVATEAVDIAETGGGSTCVLGKGYIYPTQLITLRKTDNAGNVIFETLHDVGFDFQPTKLIHTVNDEYIAVGHVVTRATQPDPNHPTLTHTYQPWAMKFDNAGNYLWMSVYQVNDLWISWIPGYSRVNICYVEDDPVNESYIITFPADQPAYAPPPGGAIGGPHPNQDVSVGAIRLNGNTGAIMWSNKYHYPLVQRDPTHTAQQDYPYALAYGNNRYFISGPTIKTNVPFVGLTSIYEINFWMGIDNMGNPTNNYRSFDAPGYNFKHDAIHDATTNQFVMCYTIGFAGAHPISNASQIAIAKFDNAALNMLSTGQYFDSDAIENYGINIKENLLHDAYILSCMTSGSVSGTGPSGVMSSILKVDKANTPIFYKSYNVGGNQPSPLTTVMNSITGLENYGLSCTKIQSTTVADIRVITTDDNGSVCGEYNRPVTFQSGDVQFFPDVPYDQFSQGWMSDYSPNAIGITATVTDCSNSASPSQYKQSNSIDMHTVTASNIYPTLLVSGENNITIELFSTNSTSVTIDAFTMDGKQIATYEKNIAQGENKFSWAFPIEIAGNYILKITSTDRTIHATQRISRL